MTNANEIIKNLIAEGLELTQIRDCFQDGLFLTENGYTDEDQELIEEINDILNGMIG